MTSDEEKNGSRPDLKIPTFEETTDYIQGVQDKAFTVEPIAHVAAAAKLQEEPDAERAKTETRDRLPSATFAELEQFRTEVAEALIAVINRWIGKSAVTHNEIMCVLAIGVLEAIECEVDALIEGNTDTIKESQTIAFMKTLSTFKRHFERSVRTWSAKKLSAMLTDPDFVVALKENPDMVGHVGSVETCSVCEMRTICPLAVKAEGDQSSSDSASVPSEESTVGDEPSATVVPDAPDTV